MKSIVLITIVLVQSLFAQSGGKDKETLQAMIKNRSQPITWVITGDSITHGAVHTNGERSYPEHLAERVRTEMGRPRDVIINTGVSGEITTGLLKDFSWRVARFAPNVVSINLGMNDCTRVPLETFKLQLTELVSKSKELKAIVILHATNTVFPESDRAKNLPAFVAAVREIASKEDVMLVDQYQYFLDHQQGTTFKTWFNDPIHPNGLGHAHMAAEMFRAIGIYDANSKTCKLAKP